jgi:protocatechuate 3,4-dioxygenase, alpha subunit
MRTPSQTVGPFFLDALVHRGDEVIARLGLVGEQIVVEGRVLDAEGNAVGDAVLEIVQCDSAGRYIKADGELRETSGFTGFGRAATDGTGTFRFTTIHPGVVCAEDGSTEAPHLDMMVFARGLLKPLVTRIYFAGDARNKHDAVLAKIPEGRRATLEARRDDKGGASFWHFDVRLQGSDETVFFDF